MKKSLAIVSYVGVALLGAVVLGVSLMILVYMLPVDSMRNNVAKSIQMQRMEGDYFTWCLGRGGGNSTLDNFTNSLMISTAIYKSDESIIKKAMNCSRPTYSDELPNNCLLHYIDSDCNDNLDSEGHICTYGRYWHGYLVILKPLLMLISPANIRMLNLFFLSLLLILVVINLYKKDGRMEGWKDGRMEGWKDGIVFPYCIAIVSMSPITSVLSMQQACLPYITMLGSLFIVKAKDVEERYYKIFFWIGVSTAFFDLLTNPIIGLGINLLLFLCLYPSDLKENFKRVFVASIVWGIGYVGMWSGKWIVGSILLGKSFMMDAIHSLLFRINGDIPWEDATTFVLMPSKVIYANYVHFMNLAVILSLMSLFIYWICNILKRRNMYIDKRLSLPIITVGLFPFLWYSVVMNHSYIHAPIFTSRNLSITLFAIAIMVFLSVKKRN